SAIEVGRETYLDLRLPIPVGRPPGEDEAARRREDRHDADVELLAIAEPLVEAAALPALDPDVGGSCSAEREALLQGPPFAHLFREEPERPLGRTLHVNRLPDGHRSSSCSAKALNASSARSHMRLTRSM